MRLYFLALFAALAFESTGTANMSAMGSGNTATGTLIPTDSKLRLLDEHPSASLQKEDLHIKLYSSYATVDLTYVMRNDGRGTTVIAGFPSIAAQSHYYGSKKGDDTPSPGTKLKGPPKDLEDYTISLNGKAVQWQLRAMGPVENKGPKKGNDWLNLTRSTQWLVSELPLAANSDSTIHITYRCPYEINRVYVSDDGSISDAIFGYQLSTGRNWRGPIHEGRVEIECVAVAAPYVRITPGKRFKPVGRSFVWEFTDLEPSTEDDIKVVADPAHEERKGYILYPDRWYYNHTPYKATATSELQEKDRHFAARNLSGDGNLCWVEGVEGDGIGESVTLTLVKPGAVCGAFIINGFSARDKEYNEEQRDALYHANNRVAKLAVTIDNQPPFMIELPDKRNGFYLPFSDSKTLVHQIKLTIAEVYRGTHYRDTCLAYIGLRQVLKKKPEVSQAR